MNRKEIPVALRPDLKFRYECTDEPVDSQAKCAGMSPLTYRRCVKELGWRPQRVDRLGRRQMVSERPLDMPVITPEDFAEAAAILPDDGVPDDSVALARRIRLAVQRELIALERSRETIDPRFRTQTESVARVLGGLTRALQEAKRLEEVASPRREKDTDDFPRDFAELRRALSQRLEAILAEREDDV